MRWLLLDEAVRYSKLLLTGETLAMYCPTVRSCEGPHAGAEPELILECSGSVLLMVRATDSSSGCKAGDVAAAVTSNALCSAAIPNCSDALQASWHDHPAALAAGQQGIVLCGVVNQVRCGPDSQLVSTSTLRNGPRLSCLLALSPADMTAGASVQVHMEFLQQSTNQVRQQTQPKALF